MYPVYGIDQFEIESWYILPIDIAAAVIKGESA